MAVPLAIIGNELLTNVIIHAGPPCRIEIQTDPHDQLTLTVSETGTGPSQRKPSRGMGPHVDQALVLHLTDLFDAGQRAEGQPPIWKLCNARSPGRQHRPPGALGDSSSLRKGRRRIRTVLDCEASLSCRNARYAWLPKGHPAQGTRQTLSRARGTDHGRHSAVYRCNRGL